MQFVQNGPEFKKKKVAKTRSRVAFLANAVLGFKAVFSPLAKFILVKRSGGSPKVLISVDTLILTAFAACHVT